MAQEPLTCVVAGCEIKSSSCWLLPWLYVGRFGHKACMVVGFPRASHPFPNLAYLVNTFWNVWNVLWGCISYSYTSFFFLKKICCIEWPRLYLNCLFLFVFFLCVSVFACTICLSLEAYTHLAQLGHWQSAPCQVIPIPTPAVMLKTYTWNQG